MLRLSPLIYSDWHPSTCIILKEPSILNPIPNNMNTIFSYRMHFLLILHSPSTSSPPMPAARRIIPSERRLILPLLTVILLLQMRLVYIWHVLRGRPLEYLNLIIVLLAHKEIVVFLSREYRRFMFINDAATSLLGFVLLLDSGDFFLSG